MALSPIRLFTSEWRPRFTAAQDKIASISVPPGFGGVMLVDRTSHASWSAGDISTPAWTASTIKLAIAAYILEHTSASDLPSEEQSDMHDMLHVSDNSATDRLWRRYGDDTMLERFRNTYGMATLAPQAGHATDTLLPWRYIKCSAGDLSSLMLYILDRAAFHVREYLVKALRGVADNQRWGVWAAGESNTPGVKAGWAQKPDEWGLHWLVRSVGFVGEGERFVVVVEWHMDAPGDLDKGVQAVSDVVALLFGEPVPARVSIPED